MLCLRVLIAAFGVLAALPGVVLPCTALHPCHAIVMLWELVPLLCFREVLGCAHVFPRSLSFQPLQQLPSISLEKQSPALTRARWESEPQKTRVAARGVWISWDLNVNQTLFEQCPAPVADGSAGWCWCLCRSTTGVNAAPAGLCEL